MGIESSALCVFQRYPAEVTDLISEGEIGSGTCGQVFKVRFKKTGHVIAVKVNKHSVDAAQADQMCICECVPEIRLDQVSIQIRFVNVLGLL